MYPSYKLPDVLEEYASVFFSLLNEGYRIRYRHYAMMAQLMLLPHAENEDRTKFMKKLEFAGNELIDILETDSTSNQDNGKLTKLLRNF